MAGQPAYYSNGRTNFPPTPTGLSAAQKIQRTPTSATSQARPLQLQFTGANATTHQQNNINAPAPATTPSSQTNNTAPAPTIKTAPAPAPNENAHRHHANGDYDDRRNSHEEHTQAPAKPQQNGDMGSDSETDDAAPLNFETVLEESLDTMQLDELDPSQANSHYGIHSVDDMHAHVTARHSDLAGAINTGSSGNILRKEIKWFNETFKSRKRTTYTVAAAATLIHMAAASPVLDTIVREALMASIGLSRYALKKIINRAANGHMADAGTGTASDLQHVHWRETLALAIEAACYNHNSQGEIFTAQAAFEGRDASSSPTIQHALAEEMRTWTIYCTALGRNPMDVYFRAERFVRSCSEDIADCYHEIIEDDMDIDVTSFTEWKQYKEILVRAWVKSERRQSRVKRSQKLFDDFERSLPDCTEQPAVHFAADTGRKEPPAPPPSSGAGDVDMVIDCTSANCHTKFAFTMLEQQQFKCKGWDVPKRCKKCRDEIRTSNGTPLGACHSFLKYGNCGFGDKCKFSHGGPLAIEDKGRVPAVHHASAGSESESDSSSGSILEMEYSYHARMTDAAKFSSSDSEFSD